MPPLEIIFSTNTKQNKIEHSVAETSREKDQTCTKNNQTRREDQTKHKSK